ncbi:MAG: hypothetical protein M3503_05655, partial [Actinomycetota bacterium]|nr:hypothetical protein [Actinomycetota bacterium]
DPGPAPASAAPATPPTPTPVTSSDPSPLDGTSPLATILELQWKVATFPWRVAGNVVSRIRRLR